MGWCVDGRRRLTAPPDALRRYDVGNVTTVVVREASVGEVQRLPPAAAVAWRPWCAGPSAYG
ncbi:hypothetical protein ACP4OV_021142 [Aristida adscensionis]